MEQQLTWLDYFDTLVPPALTLAIFIVGYFAGFLGWKRQKMKEIELKFEVSRFEKRLESCKAIWGLLTYLSIDTENDKSIFVERGKDEKGSPIYYIRKKQAEEYINSLPDVFLAQGHGVFMPPKVRDEAYDVRHAIWPVFKALLHSGNEEELLKRQEMVGAVKEKYENLIRMLREEANRNPEVN